MSGAEKSIRRSAPDASSDAKLEALFCALAIAPSTFSRNRFHEMYEDPRARNVRMRAQLVRNLVRQMLRHPDSTRLDERGSEVTVCITLPAMNFRREARLVGVEIAVLRYLLARAKGETAETERELIERIIAEEWSS